MSARQGSSTAEHIQQANGAIWRHLRLELAVSGRATTDVTELLIVPLAYEDQPTPVACYELSFRDKTSLRGYWHVSDEHALSQAEATALVDQSRLAAYERRLLDAPAPPAKEQKEGGHP